MPLRWAGEYSAKPWSEAREAPTLVMKRLETHVIESELLVHPSILIALPAFLKTDESGRRARTLLRLLRVATHHQLTGEIMEVDDPFGTRIMTQITKGRFKAWSTGKDGVDNGGEGTYADPKAADIVLGFTLSE